MSGCSVVEKPQSLLMLDSKGLVIARMDSITEARMTLSNAYINFSVLDHLGGNGYAYSPAIVLEAEGGNITIFSNEDQPPIPQPRTCEFKTKFDADRKEEYYI